MRQRDRERLTRRPTHTHAERNIPKWIEAQKRIFGQNFCLRQSIICRHSVGILHVLLSIHALLSLTLCSFISRALPHTNSLFRYFAFFSFSFWFPIINFMENKMCLPGTHTKCGFSECDPEGGSGKETETEIDRHRQRDRESYKMMMSNCQLFTTFTKPISNWFGSSRRRIRLNEGFFQFPFLFFSFSVFWKKYRCAIKFANEQKKGEKFDHFLCGRMSQLMLMIVFCCSFIGFWVDIRKRFA